MIFENIDQILLQKLTGWNMIAIEDWFSLSDSEQQEYIDNEQVVFFSAGEQIPLEEYQEAVKKGREAETVTADENRVPEESFEAAESETREVAEVVRITRGQTLQVSYHRFVVSGPKWVVERHIDGAFSELLHVFHGYDDESIYSCETEESQRILSDDLFADALGLSKELFKQVPAVAREHFFSTFFSRELGARYWQVSSEEIYFSLQRNPYIQFV